MMFESTLTPKVFKPEIFELEEKLIEAFCQLVIAQGEKGQRSQS